MRQSPYTTTEADFWPTQKQNKYFFPVVFFVKLVDVGTLCEWDPAIQTGSKQVLYKLAIFKCP